MNKDFLDSIIKQMPEIRNKEFEYYIYESDRNFSKSVYVSFYAYGKKKLYKQLTLRISDHYLPKSPHKQFLIKPYEVLKKNQLQNFKRTLSKTIKNSHKHHLYKEFEKISKGA